MSPCDSKLFRDQAYIGGKWVEASDSQRFDVTDPANGSVIASVANCTPRDAETAITAARA
ncbi:MAG: aldehyde dehydrogenase family protein, partial [Methylocella sp.]